MKKSFAKKLYTFIIIQLGNGFVKKVPKQVCILQTTDTGIKRYAQKVLPINIAQGINCTVDVGPFVLQKVKVDSCIIPG